MRSRNQSRRPAKKFLAALRALTAQTWGDGRAADLLGVSERSIERWRAGERITRQTMQSVLVMAEVAKVIAVRDLADYGIAKLTNAARDDVEIALERRLELES